MEEGFGELMTPLDYVLGYWHRGHARDMFLLFAFDALLNHGADAGALMWWLATSVSLPAYVLMQPQTECQAPLHMVHELLDRGVRFCQGNKINWVDAAERGSEAVLCVLLADAEATCEPDADGHPDDRVLDAMDVRAPRELLLDSGDVVRQDLLEWLLFDNEKPVVADNNPRSLARYITMLVDGYGFALPAKAMALAKREGVREALLLLSPPTMVAASCGGP